MKTSKDIAQWVIDNRYPKSENDKVYDFEMYNELVDKIDRLTFWDDDKVIDFVNWYIDLHKLSINYSLENQTIIDSFKNGDKASDWHK